MSIEKRIIQALERVGIFVDYNGEDIDLRESIADSFQFISAILELECEFDFEFSDEDILIDKFASLKGLATEIEELLNPKEENANDQAL